MLVFFGVHLRIVNLSVGIEGGLVYGQLRFIFYSVGIRASALCVLSRSRGGACKLGAVRVILPEGGGHQYRKVQQGNSFIIIYNPVKGGNTCDVYPNTGEISEQRDCDILYLLPGSGLDGKNQYVGGIRADGESVHRGADWTDVYGRGDH